MKSRLTDVFRRSSTALLGLALIMAMANCSKKDVTQEEPAITAGGEGAPATTEGTVGAGEAGGQTTSEMQTVYYGYDSFKLTSEARETLKATAEYMKANAGTSVQIEGHCDERGTTEYNLALGERRANAAKDYLVRLGVDASRLSIISYGEERPQDPGHDESAWSKNRRAAFVVLR